METVVKQTRQRYAKHFHKLEIKIMSSPFKSNDAWFQTNILYEIIKFYLCTEYWKHIVYLVYANMKHIKYVTFINMLIFFLKRLTPCRSEGVSLLTIS